jgi:DNA-binding protein WhiA
MALTAQVKDELARLTIDKTSCRKAEVSATLRFAGGLHIISGRIVIEAELDTGVAARRLRQYISEVYGHSSDVVVVSGGGLRRGTRYVVRVVKDGAVRCEACRPRWCLRASARRRRPGAVRSWHTAP